MTLNAYAEILTASLQFMHKISGFRKPSKTNKIAFRAVVEAIAAAADCTFDILMGDAIDRCKRFIQAHARAVRNLDI
jgi:hypothetical protein